MSDESSRWTCEACGCNTNTEQDDTITCGVCGTRREPALLRNRAYRLLQEGLVHRHLSVASRGGVYDEDDDNDDEIAFGGGAGNDDDEDEGMNYEILDDESRMVDSAAGISREAGGLGADAAVPLRGAENRGIRSAAISSLLYGDGEGALGNQGTGQRNRALDRRVIDHSSVLATATENASVYQPQWTVAVPSDAAATTNRRQVGVADSSVVGGNTFKTERHPNIACLPEGGDEGRAVRASPSLPRIRVVSSQSRGGHSHRTRSSSSPGRGQSADGGNEVRNRQVGFKVAFDHPNRADGRGMGGCYLVGLTTASAASFAPLAERHGLEESGEFWGIEDGGRRYEGRSGNPTSNPSTLNAQMRNDSSSGSAASHRGVGRLGRGGVPSSGASHGVQMGMNEAPRNSDNVLYGAREVVTVLADLDSRTLTFWRDGILLGTLVRNLPRIGNLYPVAVPFNAGVSVAITGLDGNPLNVLSEFRAAQRQSQQDRDETRRLALSDQRSKLICSGQLSQEMISILRTIFSWYGSRGSVGRKSGPGSTNSKLGGIPAARLWYRCGLRLSYLRGLLDASSEVSNRGAEPYITANDFVDLIARLVKEEDDGTKAAQNVAADENASALSPSSMTVNSRQHPIGTTSSPTHSFEVGDKVEVVEDYERHGDAASGPLRPGHRGTVMEVQQGPRGSRPSIRVVHNGRRWWYQPQALMSERSGLVETPVARLLRNILRSHGYDHATLKPLWGQNVTAESWQVGDLVVPARLPRGQDKRKNSVIGRIIADSSISPLPVPLGGDSSYVTVEFADPSFGNAVGGVRSNGIGTGSSLTSTKRVRVHNLVHTTFHHRSSVVDIASTTLAHDAVTKEPMGKRRSIEPDSDDQCEDFQPNIDDCSETDEAEGMEIEAPFIVNGLLKANLAQISTLKLAAISSTTKECRQNKASLASMFGAGLPDAITSALDHAEDRVEKAIASGKSTSGISASSLSALCGLAVLVSKQLFVDEDDGKNAARIDQATTISARPLASNNSSSPPNQAGAIFSHPVLPSETNQRLASAGNLSQQSSRVRDLIRDLGASGSSAEERRSLLLALMSRARMNDEAQNLVGNLSSASTESDYRSLVSAAEQSRSGQLFSLIARNGAEPVPFGLGTANPPNHSALLDDLGSMLDTRSGGLGSIRATGEGQMPSNASNSSSSGGRRPNSSHTLRSNRARESSSTGRQGSSARGRRPSTSLTLLETVLREGGAGGDFFFRSPITMHRVAGGDNAAAINAQARSLIYNGLLLNDLLWAQKSLGMSGVSDRACTLSPSPASIDLMSVRDDDEATPLQLAIFLGCPTALAHTLIKAGAVVGEQEVHEAALSNQPRTLSLLLWHTTYTVGSFDISHCSTEVVKVLEEASNRQKIQEETMKRNARRFVSTLIRKAVHLALKFRVQGRKVGDFFPECELFAQTLSDALVGKVLLYALHESQRTDSSDVAGSSGSVATAEDGRMPAFTSNEGSDPESGRTARNTGRVWKSDSCLPLALLHVIPTSCFVDALKDDDAPDKTSDGIGASEITGLTTEQKQKRSTPCLQSFLRLSESYSWSKKVGDEVIGLSLMRTLLEKAPLICDKEVGRYGIKDLAISHYKLAEDSLSEISRQTSIIPSPAVVDSGNHAMSVERTAKVSPAAVVLCPKQHHCVLHLTRHSSFRCDICGKGVDQGKPMHGCRECDWDACEICTDKAEGGIVKWTYVRDLAMEVRHLLSVQEGHRMSNDVEDTGDYSCGVEDQIACTLDEELWSLSQSLRQRNCASVRQLELMLSRVTIHEFSSYILPSLHDALVGCGNALEQDNGLSRRRKKARVSDGSKDDVGDAGAVVATGEADFDAETDFNRAVVRLILSTHECSSVAADSISLPEETQANNEEEEEDDDDDDDDDNDEDDKESDDESEEQREESVEIPELLQLLHSTMAFHERVPVRKHKLIRPSHTSSVAGGAGELQSLTLPFEIELLPSPKGCERDQTNEAQGFRDQTTLSTCPSVNRGIVHVEPLMPMRELQLHVLRTCRICEPSLSPAYLHFCRRLANDRAIIAEKPAKAEDFVGNTTTEETIIRRIAQIVAFDEAAGAHVVRYASRLLQNVEDSMLQSDIFDQLEFQGRERMLVLASRDYYILRRDEGNASDNNMVLHDGDGSYQEVRDVDKILRTEAYALQNSMRLSSVQQPLYAFQHTGRHTTGNANELNASESLPGHRTALLPVGTRVESNVDSLDSWFPCTILSGEIEDSCGGSPNLYFGNAQVGALGAQERRSPTYSLVTDSGEVRSRVRSKNIRNHNALLQYRHARTQRESRASQEGGADSFGSRVMYGRARDPTFSEINAGRSENPLAPTTGVLKRTWSALSPIENMCSIDLFVPGEEGGPSEPIVSNEYGETTPTIKVGGDEFHLKIPLSNLEKMPSLAVEFSVHENRPTSLLPLSEEDTVFGALRRISGRDNGILQKISSDRKCRLYFSIKMEATAQKEENGLPSTYSPQWAREGITNEDFESDDTALYQIAKSFQTNPSASTWEETAVHAQAQASTGTRKRKTETLCEGLSTACTQCMQLLSVLAENLTKYHRDLLMLTKMSGKNEVGKIQKRAMNLKALLPMFESHELTTKLFDQLEDPLAVVGGALPDWCMAAPSFCPRVFSHSSRRLLLERAAFGVSRSALRQQDAIVAVAPLRQRMAALRGRAVELVGEAFSGGAADPTALQLQADELYGMEEALAARVKAAFRTQRWDECSLQCAKAAVRRDALLTDAAIVMGKYCNDTRARRRRLEVRFKGESGFDAASGNQAGVTRGFYADVAEALLSSDHVSSVHCPPSICPSGNRNADVARTIGPSESPLCGARKLPLWIPDLDSSHKVIIPTPRADAHSHLGVFPRPLPSCHPQYKEVLVQFRFIGRLFAAALRDGFVFPLPLSTSFLKLVQAGPFDDGSFVQTSESSSLAAPSNMSTRMDDVSNAPGRREIFTYNIKTPYAGSTAVANEAKCNPVPSSGSNGTELILTSQDLPRPGFLGGEVSAVESHICSALDELDCAEPALSLKEMRRCRDEIASDKSFGRKTLGKSYDCSFEDYFEERTFVDPMDPSQGEDAFPLCPNGHLRSVTIDNVRDWAMLAKQFILSGGVQAQALAFRHGIDDFFSADALRLFSVEELQRDVCGGGDNVDNWDERAIRVLFKLDGGKGAAEALVAVAAMGGEGGAALSRRFGPSSPTIGYLVKALLEATPTQRRQFLSFVTSVPIVTPGAIEVVPMVNPSGDFLPMHDPSCLPRANTCARRLYLPKFETYDCFTKVIWAVVQEECRFKGFFEWRG